MGKVASGVVGILSGRGAQKEFFGGRGGAVGEILAGGGVGGNIATLGIGRIVEQSLFGEDPKPPAPKAPEKAVDTSEIRKAREKEQERIQKKKGRSSTIRSRRGGLLGSETTGGLLGG